MGAQHIKLADYQDNERDDDDDHYYDGNYNEANYNYGSGESRCEDNCGDSQERGYLYDHFPIVGTQQTASTNSDVTDSAAAGTALATAQRTSNGTIAMDATHSKQLPSMMIKAKELGWKTAVLSSVSLDHATPAAFYAHSKSRNSYHKISDWVTIAGLDIYAGAGFKDLRDNLTKFKREGYTIFRGEDADIEDARRVVWIQQSGKNSSQLPYKVDRDDDDMELPDMLEETIEWMEENRAERFIVMAEGGLIDWASHDNNARRVAGEVEDLIDTVEEALDFYEDHPNETLIIVTADHETGGLYFDSQGKAKWTTTGHTDADVPVFAIGVGAENFKGSYKNSELSQKIFDLIK